MTELAIYCAEALVDDISLSCHLEKPFDVACILPNGIAYSLLLHYIQELWPDLNIIDNASIQDGTPFYRAKVVHPVAYI
jgi:hypothetical protein